MDPFVRKLVVELCIPVASLVLLHPLPGAIITTGFMMLSRVNLNE